MMGKYKPKLNLPNSQEEFELRVTSVMAEVKGELKKGKDCLLSLEDGLICSMILKATPDLFIKFAFPPGSNNPCYASALCIIRTEYGEIVFPYGPGITEKVDMVFDDAPNIPLKSKTIDEITTLHRPFTKDDRKGRYIGTAKERARMIMDLMEGLTILEIPYRCIWSGYPEEFFAWVILTAD